MVVISLTKWMLNEQRGESRSTLGNIQQNVMILDTGKNQDKHSVWLKNLYLQNEKKWQYSRTLVSGLVPDLATHGRISGK